jgi:hypothetical protein
MTSTYRVTWTEVSHHERDLTAEELAELLDVSADDIDPDDTEGLADALADLDDDGFQYLTREDIEVTAND